MKIRLKAPDGLSSTGIYGQDGKEMPVGHEMTVKEEPKGWAGRYDILSGGTAEGGEPVTNQSAYAVVEKDGGWFAVTKDGQEVTKSFRKGDVDGFDGMSEQDKEAFVDLHKKDA